MTPLVHESTATVTTVTTAHMSPPVSPKCSRRPPSPSPSSSGTISRLFRPWRPAEGRPEVEEGRKEVKTRENLERQPEESSRRRRKKEDREIRRNRKRSGDGKGKIGVQTLSLSAPCVFDAAASPLRPPSRVSREDGTDNPPGSTLSPSPSLSQAQGSGGHHLLQDPHLVIAGLHHPFLHPPPHHLPPHHLPPHLDPVLLAEMTDSELERMGLLGGGYGATDPSLADCGVANPRGLSRASGTGKKQRPKKYRCPHCQVAFSNNGQLRGHVRIHTGERPFSCEYEGCGKAFTRNEELTRHRRIHSGQRPFACPLCDKRFGRKDHLKKHARTHAPPPPSPHPYLLAHGAADPRLLMPPLAFPSAHGLLLASAGGMVEPLPPTHHTQRIVEMAALAGFPYLYGY